MLSIKKESKWSFETSESKGVGVSLLVAIQGSKGAFYAHNPVGGLTQFHYADLGVGAGTPGGKLPIKLPKEGSVSFSSKDFPSRGKIYILNGFPGDELHSSDLTGICMFTEVSASAVIGGSATAMLLGIHDLERELWEELQDLASIFAGPHATARRLIKRLPQGDNWAKAILFMGGVNVGIQLGASIVGGFGAVWMGDVESIIPDVDLPFEPVKIALRSSSVAKELQLIVPSDALFDFDKDAIGTKRRPAAAAMMLTQVASTLRSYPAYRIVVIGYTDSIGPAAYNQKLSERRANKVRDWLIRNGGVKVQRFQSVRGEGESEPVAPNNNPRGRAKNRRVEIRLIPS